MTSDRRRKKHPRYLRDIVSYGESVIGKLHDVSFDAFARDADLRDLVAHRYPQIPWRDVRDIGNHFRHEYENVDAEVVWETVTSGELLALVTVAQSELAKLDG